MVQMIFALRFCCGSAGHGDGFCVSPLLINVSSEFIVMGRKMLLVLGCGSYRRELAA